jgi:hypothetical protein
MMNVKCTKRVTTGEVLGREGEEIKNTIGGKNI